MALLFLIHSLGKTNKKKNKKQKTQPTVVSTSATIRLCIYLCQL